MLLTLLMAHHPLMLTGFEEMQGGLIDSRLVHWILEYTFRAVLTPGLDLWHPPIFFPQPNMAAYTDLMLTVAPMYWVLRLVAQPQVAYGLWLICCTVLTFGSVLLLLRVGLRLSVFSAGLGATLLAAGAVRVHNMLHPQLIFPVFIVLSLLCLILVFRRPRPTPAGRAGMLPLWLLYLGFVLGGVAQLYGSFYLGYFYLLALLLVMILALAVGTYRRPLLRTLRADWLPLAVALTTGLLVSLPMLSHYLAVASLIEPPRLAEVSRVLPRPQGWFHMGQYNLLYSSLTNFWPLKDIPVLPEQPVTFGPLTTLVFALGCYRGRKSRLIQLLFFSVLLLVLITTALPGDLSLWAVVRQVLPGAEAMRMVGRVSLVLALPVCVGVAVFVERALLSGERRRVIDTLLIAAFCLVEQLETHCSYKQIEADAGVNRLIKLIDRDKTAFFYIPYLPGHEPYALEDQRHQVDAMWASIKMAKPTLNGHTGHLPPGWPFANLIADTQHELKERERGLVTWVEQNQVPRDQVQVIVLDKQGVQRYLPSDLVEPPHVRRLNPQKKQILKMPRPQRRQDLPKPGEPGYDPDAYKNLDTISDDPGAPEHRPGAQGAPDALKTPPQPPGAAGEDPDGPREAQP